MLTKERREEIQKKLSEANLPYVYKEATGDFYDKQGSILINFVYHDEDAELIENAPTWLQQYEDTVQALEAENERLKGINGEIAKISEKRHWERERYFEALTIAMGALINIHRSENQNYMQSEAEEAIDRINKLKP